MLTPSYPVITSLQLYMCYSVIRVLFCYVLICYHRAILVLFCYHRAILLSPCYSVITYSVITMLFCYYHAILLSPCYSVITVLFCYHHVILLSPCYPGVFWFDGSQRSLECLFHGDWAHESNWKIWVFIQWNKWNTLPIRSRTSTGLTGKALKLSR